MMGRRRNQRHAGGGAAHLRHPGINLFAGQMAALAGFCALRHFDLNLFCTVQVGAGHAEPAGGNLLDGTVFDGSVPGRVFTALAGVGLAAQGVHGNGHALVGFLGNGAIGHGTGFEPLDNLPGRLHLVQGNTAVFGIAELHQTPQGVGAALVVHQIGVFPEFFIGIGAHGLPQRHNGLGVIHMVFRPWAGAKLVGSGGIQGGIHAQIQQVKSVVMPPLDTLADFLQPDALHRADRAGEIVVNHLVADADRLKNLGGLVGLQGGNAHLGGNFYDAVKHGSIIVMDGLIHILIQPVLFHQLRHALLGEIGVDGAGTITQQGCKMVDIPRLCGFQNDGDRRPLFGAHQILLNGGHRQQGRNGHVIFVHAPVRENDDVCAVPIGTVTFHKQPIHCIFQGGIFIV